MYGLPWTLFWLFLFWLFCLLPLIWFILHLIHLCSLINDSPDIIILPGKSLPARFFQFLCDHPSIFTVLSDLNLFFLFFFCLFSHYTLSSLFCTHIFWHPGMFLHSILPTPYQQSLPHWLITWLSSPLCLINPACWTFTSCLLWSLHLSHFQALIHRKLSDQSKWKASLTTQQALWSEKRKQKINPFTTFTQPDKNTKAVCTHTFFEKNILK